MKRPKLTDEQRQEIINMWVLGHTTPEICKKMKRGRAVIRLIIKKHYEK